MAALYGRVGGAARSDATRTGHEHMSATLQTWQGALTVRLDRDGTATVELHEPGHRAPAGHGRIVWKGNVHEHG